MKQSARVTLLPDPAGEGTGVAGPVRSIQEAEVVLPPGALDELWQVKYLERLAHAYWQYLTRVSRGLIQVAYAADAPTVVLISRRLPLLGFRRPEYVVTAEVGRVSWPIERGPLVAVEGRGQGHLTISVYRESEARVRVRAEVANYYPFLRGGGPFARLGARIYSATQLRIHVRIAHGFLRSLERLDLPHSETGAPDGDD